MTKLPDVLYHYCSLESAIAILENQTLRLSSIFHLNDGLEFKWLQEMALNRINAMEDAPFDSAAVSSTKNMGTYCFCMSELADSLGQCRAYAGDGNGVALGINPLHFGLQQQGASWHLFGQRYSIALSPICYETKEQLKLIDECLRRAQMNLRQNDILPSPVEQASYAAKVFLAEEAGRCKNPAFHEEHEWRLIYRRVECHTPYVEESYISKLGVSLSGKTLVPFHEYSFNKKSFERPPILRIVLGPNVNAETERTLELFLYDREYINGDKPSVELVRSKASYRRL